jgi:hypothetical protein
MLTTVLLTMKAKSRNIKANAQYLCPKQIVGESMAWLLGTVALTN